MGSPITFSGFNQIDFNVILNAVMAQEREPLTRLESQRKALDTQKTAFGTLAGKLTALQTAVEALREPDSLARLQATSSDASVGVATTSGTVSGTYDLVVHAVAQAQVMQSEHTFASPDTEVATGGSFTLSGPDGDTIVTLTGPTTLQELAAAINANDGAPARAAVVRTGASAYRLVLTAVETGVDGAFTITNGLTGSLTFADTDEDGVSGDDAADNVRGAQDAQLTVNGVAVISASNTVKDVVPGATLSLKSADAAKVVVVDVTRDTTAAADAVQKFVTAYNDLQTFMKAQDTDAVAGKASIGRDPLLRGFRDAVRQALQAVHGPGTVARLAVAGLSTDMSGQLKLDRKMFDQVIGAEPAAMQELFSGADGNGGAFGALSTLVESYTEAGGLVSDARDRIDDQLKNLRARMDRLDAQLAVRRAALQKQYIAADLAMSQLNSQSGSLQSLGSEYRLF